MYNAGKMALLVPKGIQRYPDSGDTVKVQSYHIITMKKKHHKNSKKEKDQAKNGDDSFTPGLELSLFG